LAYQAHPSVRLRELFSEKPYQGVAPVQATFLFVGLDANYHPLIERNPVFSKVLAYHADGVEFWRTHGVHHPFLLPEYSGDGQFYHRSFARIGFSAQQAGLVSFVELLHVPTAGRNKLDVDDLSEAHLRALNAAILEGNALHVFLPAGVSRLMRSSKAFAWLPESPVARHGPLDVLFRGNGKTVYSHLHFSVYGKFQNKKTEEAAFISELARSVA
jgi:hypothetical protein